jgi:hypothetical protein
LKKVSDNAYQLELSNKFNIYPTFNVVDLYKFHEGENGDDEGTLDGWEQYLPVKQSGAGASPTKSKHGGGRQLG